MKKRLTLLLLLIMMLALCVSCATFNFSSLFIFGKHNAEVESVEIPSEEIVEIKEDIAKEIPIAEPVQIIKEEAIKEDFAYKYIYKYGAIVIEAEAHNGYGYVTYPTSISDQELLDAANAFVKAHGNFGVTYQKTEPGKLYVTYAEGYKQSDFNYIASMVQSDLDWYIGQIVAKYEAAKAEESRIKETKVEEAVVESVIEPVIEPILEPVKEEPKVEPVVTVAESPKTEPVEVITAVATTTTSTTAEEAVPVIISEKTAGLPPAVGIACGVVSICIVICYFIFRKKDH